MTPAINLSPVTPTPVIIIHCEQHHRKIIAGASYTDGDETLATKSACLHLNVNIKYKIITLMLTATQRHLNKI
jgi:hypothetical protein